MTDEELVAIEARAEAAVGGTWMSFRDEMTASYGQHRYGVIAREGEPGARVAFHVDGFHGADMAGTAAFIAHARADVPALVAEVRRLQGLLLAAEWKGGDIVCDACLAVCPWCEAREYRGEHAPTCPAFGVGR